MPYQTTRQRLGRFLPVPLRKKLTRFLYRLRGIAGARRLHRAVRSGAPLRIVVGSCGIVEPGWTATDIECLNLLRETDWQRYFIPDSIAVILAEHVWEHLASAEGFAAAKLCHRYLKPGGHLRIAVPDGFHPDPAYIELTRVGGIGAGADDHQVLYNHETLGQLLVDTGFEVEWLEYFDEARAFHFREWDPADGMIHRSQRFDVRNRDGRRHYTSLLADARKHAIASPPTFAQGARPRDGAN